MRCEYCEKEFLNSDEFIHHIRKEYLKILEEILGYKGPQSPYKTHEKLAESLLTPRFQTVAPLPPLYSFEVMQLTNIALITSKTAADVITMANEIKYLLGRSQDVI